LADNRHRATPTCSFMGNPLLNVWRSEKFPPLTIGRKTLIPSL
jgi:hypothetical protein